MVIKMKYRKLILSLILIVVLVIGCVRLEFQNDTFYSIKIGEDIIKYGVDFLDHHSFHNLAYSYPHNLFDVIVYLVYSFGNFRALYLLTIIFCLIFGLVTFYVNNKLSKNFILSLMFTLLMLISMKQFITLRAQVFSITIFLLQYYLLYVMLINKNKKKINTLLLFILGILLVNSHVATYLFYLIMFIPFIIASKFRKDIILSFILCLLCGFISFMGIDSYTYLINTLLNDTTNYIQEHQPLVLIETPSVILFLIIILWMFNNKIFKLELCDILILLGVIVMSFSSIRHTMFLNMYTILVLCKNMGKYSLKKEKRELLKIDKFVFSIKGFCIVLLITIIISSTSFLVDKDKKFINNVIYPVDAVKYIKNNLDYKNIRMFNDINIGSYLMLNDIPVFIDSRTDLYTKTYNHSRDIFNDYVDVIKFNRYYDDVFGEFNINYVLLPRYSENIVKFIYRNDNYEVIYEDDFFVMFVRR